MNVCASDAILCKSLVMVSSLVVPSFSFGFVLIKSSWVTVGNVRCMNGV